MIDLNTLRVANRQRQEEWPGNEKADIAFRALEVFDESGEVAGAVKKVLRAQRGIAGTTLTLADVQDEIGDTVVSLDLLADALGISSEGMTPTHFQHPEAGGAAQRTLLLSRAIGALSGHVFDFLSYRGQHGPDVAAIHVRYKCADAAKDVIAHLQGICTHLEIDFHEAWIIKFNKTSEKYGMRTQVDPHCDNPVVSVAPKEGGLL